MDRVVDHDPIGTGVHRGASQVDGLLAPVADPREDPGATAGDPDMGPHHVDYLALGQRGELPGVAAGHEEPRSAVDEAFEVPRHPRVVDRLEPITGEGRRRDHRDVGEDLPPGGSVRGHWGERAHREQGYLGG